jgi:aryl-alcohol dehydrogenase-like predicted oxidoreductase
MHINDDFRSRIALGTVQLGMAYGIRNIHPQPAPDECASILDAAAESNIRTIDTAAIYGTSEARIGEYIRRHPGGSPFDIVTKIPPWNRLERNTSLPNAVLAAVASSLERLGVPCCDAVLVHHAPDLLSSEGTKIWEGLVRCKEEGLVKRIGASTYDPETTSAVIERYPVEVVQIPFSIIDRRHLESGVLSVLKTKGIEIHARSVFLQGALLARPGELPDVLRGLDSYLDVLREAAANAKLSTAELCLGWVLGNGEIDKAVVGVHTARQLREIASMNLPADRPDANLPMCRDLQIIEPYRWKT